MHTPGPGPSSRSSPLRSDSGVSQQKQVKLILSDCRVLLANIVLERMTIIELVNCYKNVIIKVNKLGLSSAKLRLSFASKLGYSKLY